MEDESELARLRHVAFSREGTAEDLRRLAELERPAHQGTPRRAAGASTDPTEQTKTTPGTEPQTAAAAPLSRSRRPLLIAAAAGLLVGALATFLVAIALERDSTPEHEPSALAVFDRAAGDADDPDVLSVPLDQVVPDYLDNRELRFLGEGLGWRAYALRASTFRLTQICLLIDSSQSMASSCAGSDDFAERGLTISSGMTTFRWDPDSADLWIAAGSR